MRRLSCFLAMMVGIGLYSSAFAGPQKQGSGEVFHLKIDEALAPYVGIPPAPGPGYLPVVHDGGPLRKGAKARIHRNMDGVTVKIKLDDLNPYHVYTLWFVEIGVGGPPPFLAGDITGKSGKGWFSGHMSAENPMGGEFHVILADHGPLYLLPPGYDLESSVPPIGLESDGVTWRLDWPMVVIFEP